MVSLVSLSSTFNGNSSNSSSSSNEVEVNSTARTTTIVPDPESRLPVFRGIQIEEIIIVSIIVIFWVFAVMAFLRKWDSIRIMQPVEPRYRHSPKNLDSVKVVKRAQDSVIYKNYSRKMSVTMVEREKRRLQRMHTMPCMSILPSVHSAIKSTLPTIHMEEVTTEM